MRVALGNIWLGRLPAYTDFFARSCEPNADLAHWYLFTDQVEATVGLNAAVTLVPYSWEQLARDCPHAGTLPRTPRTLQMWPSCRLAIMPLYFPQAEFVGTFDLDVIHGDLGAFLPEDWGRYGMITGHAGRLDPRGPRNCMAFGFYRRDCLGHVFDYPALDGELDESYRFFDYFADRYPVWSGGNLQPIGDSIPHSGVRHMATWHRGKLLVCGVPGGLIHLMYLKQPPFRCSPRWATYDHWHVSDLGILPVPMI